MVELELRLDEAIDRLNDGREPGVEPAGELSGLVELARALRSLDAEDWPDRTFPQRLAASLADELAPRRLGASAAKPPAPGRKTGRPRRPGRLPRLRVGAGLAAAAAVAIAVALVVVLDRPSPVGAATLAREALAASSGRSLGPVRFTQVITNVPAGFRPVPPPPRVVEHVVFAGSDRWRVEATVTEPRGEGVTKVLTVRNGGTIVSVRTSPDEGTTETRQAAGAGSGLPTASAYGSQIDPLTLLAGSQGRCGRSLAPVEDGPVVDGRATQLLRVGAAPCPSASVPELDGPATFVVDRRTHLVLEAKVHGASGELTQYVVTRALTTGGAIASDAFRLPQPLPKQPAASGATFRPRLPTDLPDGLHAGPVTPVQTQAATGKTIAVTVTYRNRDGRAELQLYEAAASTPSVRFPGRAVVIRPGVAGTFLDRDNLQILWWVDGGTYVSLQQGGSSAGVPLGGRFPLDTLLRIARSVP